MIEMKRELALLAIIMTLVVPAVTGSSGTPSSDPSSPGPGQVRSDGYDTPIFDGTVTVPPGGETRIWIDGDGIAHVEGYGGLQYFDHGKLGQASSMAPEWMREAFVDNMLKAGSVPLTGEWIIPTFGDTDGDGDDDMVVGVDGTLYFYENVGWPGNPIFSRTTWYLAGETTSLHINDTYCSPCLAKIDSDPYLDLIVGGTEGFVFLFNPRSQKQDSIPYLTINRMDHVSPTVIGRSSYFLEGEEIYNLTILYGERHGGVSIWSFQTNDDLHLLTGTDLPGRVFWFDPVLTYAAPRSWWSYDDRRGEMDQYIALGSGEGGLELYGKSGGQNSYESIDGHFNGIPQGSRVTPVPIDLDGDRLSDLVLGSGDGWVRSYVDFGVEHSPYWRPFNSQSPPEMANYLSAFDRELTVYDESLIEEYLDSIIDPIDTRYRDEIAFACAYTPPDQIRNNGLAPLFQENARLIYERDAELDYVSIVEVPGEDGHTTAQYNVRVGSRYDTFEIPREIYYWGMVHPRITEEPVGYVDPDTGSLTDPSSGGRFWREYLWEHADSSYPPGPEYPADWAGPRAYYPENEAPPLLKEVLTDPIVLWDLQPYEYPRGFDNAGEVNGHPWDHRDHAVEKVSHWVEKTLVLNQQESPDDERPTQPVRIAAGHNGNCGELQDLTIAAARSALIPARGVLLMGEDHVWSEFYAGGWHQWDNYWSDAGGVVANQMNYWWEWGERGGSGIMALWGDGSVEDVTDTYRPSTVTGSLTVTVRDANGIPVQGARVLVMSHWAMQQMSIDIGPYQAPPPVTVPLPSIYGYTDLNGEARFAICHQEFHIVVTSDIGNFVSNKMTIADDQQASLDVRLVGNQPYEYFWRGTDLGYYNDLYLLQAKIDHAYQEQSCFLSGVRHRQSVEAAMVTTMIYPDQWTGSYSPPEDVIGSDTEYRGLFPGSPDFQNTSLHLRSYPSNFKTYVSVRVRIYTAFEGWDANVIKPDDGPSDDLVGLVPVYGWVVVPEVVFYDGYEISDISLTMNGEEQMVSASGPALFYDTIIPWQGNLTGLMIGENPCGFRISIEVQGRTINISCDFVQMGKDARPPRLLGESKYEPTVAWGSEFSFGPMYVDSDPEVKALSWIDDAPLQGSLGPPGPTADSAHSGPGHHWLRTTLIDGSGQIATYVNHVLFNGSAPIVDIISPLPGEHEYATVGIRGRVTDDVEVTGIALIVDEDRYDLTPYLDPDGAFSYELDLGGPGPYSLRFNATDNVGLFTVTSVDLVILPPPDMDGPFVEITDPGNGERVRKGSILKVRGTATDEGGISSLRLRSPSGTIDLRPTFEGFSWQVDLDTDAWRPGPATIAVDAVDGAGNSGSDSVSIEIIDIQEDRPDVQEPVIVLTTPTGGPFDIAGEIEVAGYITDDSGGCDASLSLDGGATFADLVLGARDGYFRHSMPANELIAGLEKVPETLLAFMAGYRIVIRAVDPSGNRDEAIVPLELIDTDPPKVTGFSGVRKGEDMAGCSITIQEQTCISEVRWTLQDGDGRYLSSGRLGSEDMVEDEKGFRSEWDIGLILETGPCDLSVVAFDAFGNPTTAMARIPMASASTYKDEGPGILPLLAGTLIAFILFVVIAIAYIRVRRIA